MSKAYIKYKREEVLSWGVENFTKGVKYIGIRNISLFCEMVGLDEKYIRSQIKAAGKDGLKYCIVDGWKISWMSIDDVRAMFEKHGVALSKRMGDIVGKVYKNKKDFEPGDFEMQKVLERFGV